MMLGVWIGLLCHFTHNVHLNGQDHGRVWTCCCVTSFHRNGRELLSTPAPSPVPGARDCHTVRDRQHLLWALHHNAGCRIASYCILHHQLGLGLICCRATVYMGKSCYVASLSTAFLHIALSVHNAAVESLAVFRTTQLGSGS